MEREPSSWVDRHFPATDTEAWKEWKAEREAEDRMRVELLARDEVSHRWWHAFGWGER